MEPELPLIREYGFGAFVSLQLKTPHKHRRQTRLDQTTSPVACFAEPERYSVVMNFEVLEKIFLTLVPRCE